LTEFGYPDPQDQEQGDSPMKLLPSMLKTTTALSMLILIGAGSAGVGSTMAQEEDDKLSETGWFNSTELSVVVTEGNSGTDTFGFKNVLSRKWEKSDLILKVDSVRSNTDDDRFLLAEPGIIFLPGEAPTIENTTVIQPPKELDVEKYFAEGRYTKHYKKTKTWNTGASWDRNEDAGILNRFIVFGGVGNRWRDSEKLHFETGYGLSFTDRQEKTPDPEKEAEFPGARFTLSLDWGITKTTRLAYDLTGNLNFEDTSDYSLDSRAALSVSISERIALAVSLQFLYNSEPGLEDVDIIARIEIIDPDGIPGNGDEFIRTVSEGGSAIELGEDRIRLHDLDSVFRTSLVINF